MKVFEPLFSKSGKPHPLIGISLLLTFLFVPLASKRKVAKEFDVIIVDAQILVGDDVLDVPFSLPPKKVLQRVIPIFLVLSSNKATPRCHPRTK